MDKKYIDIGFTGDLSFSGYFKGCEADDSLLDDGIKDFLNKNDYNVINFESPVTPSRISKKKRLAHRCGDEALDFVKRNIKNPVLSFANNHMMDFGYIGVIDTIDSCKAKKLPCIGIGLNVKKAARFAVLGDEIKVAVLAIEYKKYLVANETTGGPLHESKKDEIKAAIKAMKQTADYAVVVYHGGDEFLNAPMPYIRRQLKQYLAWGADAVVAHHPHVVQGYEYVGKKPIFYSLGNFVFDTDYQRVQENTENGMLLSLRFTREGISFDSQATHIDREVHKVVCGDDRRFFTDVSKGYDKLWSREAARKKDTKDRAEKLKEEELAEREERVETERVRIEAIQKAAELKKAMYEKSDREIAEEGVEGASDTDAEEETVENKKTLHDLSKAMYKRLVVKRQDNVRAVVIRFGALKAKTIYR